MKVLIADDTTVSRHILESIVKKWGYDIVATSDGNQAWAVLQEPDAPRLAILDWMMPGLTGPEVCKRVREQGIEPYTYILLLTSRTEKEDVIEGMEAGADDYIAKPFDQQELNVRLRAGRRILELQDALLAAQEALRQQARRDALTGLTNRGRIVELLDEALQKPGPTGVILLDLDRFKSINDTYGHEMGDEALSASAAVLNRNMTELDVVGRYGGEEFLVVSKRATDDLINFANALRESLESTPIESAGRVLNITASFGVSSSSTPVQANWLLRAADEALYAAKRAGRNRVEYQTPEQCPA